ncbi:MAG: hypothetical protein IPM57_03490 [Oligoflexia bacterium]|nr:hypothetical protein [Oligoflexia bacterium]
MKAIISALVLIIGTSALVPNAKAAVCPEAMFEIASKAIISKKVFSKVFKIQRSLYKVDAYRSKAEVNGVVKLSTELVIHSQPGNGQVIINRIHLAGDFRALDLTAIPESGTTKRPELVVATQVREGFADVTLIKGVDHDLTEEVVSKNRIEVQGPIDIVQRANTQNFAATPMILVGSTKTGSMAVFNPTTGLHKNFNINEAEADSKTDPRVKKSIKLDDMTVIRQFNLTENTIEIHGMLPNLTMANMFTILR